MRKLVLALLGLLVAVAGLSAATQYVASSLGYPRQFGTPAVAFGGHRLYEPWAWILWSDRYERFAPKVFANASGITTGGALLAACIFALGAVVGRRKGPKSIAHGSARWAETKEIARAGLLTEEGVVLCQTAAASYQATPDGKGGVKWVLEKPGQLIRHQGPEHIFCFAPTRSGKGVGLVNPTLLSWPHSCLVYDIKKELWTKTAGWRRQFSHAWRFEPTAMDSLRFNPLLEIRRGLNEVKDAQNVADILVDPTGAKEEKDHWQSTGHALLVGAILHVLYAEEDKSLAGVAQFLSDPSRNQFDTLNLMMNTNHLPEGPHPVVAGAAREMKNKSENELSGVFSTAMACLGLYRDPIIARNTSASDFRIQDLMHAENPVSLYLVVAPSDLSRTRPLIRLLLNQIGRRLTESMGFGQEKHYKHRLLLLLDEFPSLGRLDFFETSLAFIAGYGIKAFLIGQSLNQLAKAYGQRNSILDNCHVRVTYASNDAETAKTVSELLGQATESKVVKSRSGAGLWMTGRSESDQEFARPLLTPGEIGALPQDEAVLFVGGLPPYRGKKVMYYLDERFAGRDQIPPPDSQAEQLGELLSTRGPTDWNGMLAQATVVVGIGSAPGGAATLEPGRPPSPPGLTTGTEPESAAVFSQARTSDGAAPPAGAPPVAGSETDAAFDDDWNLASDSEDDSESPTSARATPEDEPTHRPGRLPL